MNSAVLIRDKDKSIQDILEAWEGLALTALDPLPLSSDMIRAIVNKSNDPVPLLKFKPKTEEKLARFARSNLFDPERDKESSPYDGPDKAEFCSVRTTIHGDFRQAAYALLDRIVRIDLEMRMGLFEKARTPFLHGDGRLKWCFEDENMWNLTGRVEALEMWAGRQASLKRADPALIEAARFDPYVYLPPAVRVALLSPEEIAAQGKERDEAVATLKAQGVLVPLDLGIVYLMRNSRAANGSQGCQHMSSPDVPAYSGFFRSRVYCGYHS